MEKKIGIFRVMIDESALKTFVQGFLGATTFGAYNQYLYNKQFEKMEKQIEKKDEQISKLEDIINKLNRQIDANERKRGLLW